MRELVLVENAGLAAPQLDQTAVLFVTEHRIDRGPGSADAPRQLLLG